MPIRTTNTRTREVTESFVGRTVKVVTFVANRNHSDTLDYTDIRPTTCTEALVWLGPVGKRPYNRAGQMYVSSWGEDVELSPLEQFAWIDCTNLIADRLSHTETAEVDAVLEKGTGSRELWKAYFAWTIAVREDVQRRAAEAEALRAKYAAEDAKKREAQAKRQATAAAKSAAGKAAAEAQLAAAPAKGTRVRVGSFVGVVSWRGVKEFRGRWNARLGVKKGTEMVWCNAGEAVPA